MNTSNLTDYTKKLSVQSTVLFKFFCNYHVLIKKGKLVFTCPPMEKILFLTQKQAQPALIRALLFSLIKYPNPAILYWFAGAIGGTIYLIINVYRGYKT
ncbi:hypothetical protein BROC_00183 [Candidatus Brocadiaceae bacterium]|nr:hypothetical protein BROC_00183 [Candidatus Brocadiaceae bacterium]